MSSSVDTRYAVLIGATRVVILMTMMFTGAMAASSTVFARGNADGLTPAIASKFANYLYTEEPGRKALVLANSHYVNMPPIAAAANDGPEIAKTLAGYGFTLHRHKGRTSVTFEDVNEYYKIVQDFAKSVDQGDFVVIFFSGHGFSSPQGNFLAPLKAVDVVAQDQVKNTYASLSVLVNRVNKQGPAKILILTDACRGNATFKITNDDGNATAYGKDAPDTNKGRVPVNNGRSSSVAVKLDISSILHFHSADNGSLSYSPIGADELSYFTKGLVDNIKPEHKFSDIAGEVAVATRVSSGMLNQRPVVNGDTGMDVYFKAPDAWIVQVENAWKSVLESASVGMNKVHGFYLKFGLSPYGSAARKVIEDASSGHIQFSALGVGAPATRISAVATELLWRGDINRVLAPVGNLLFAREQTAPAQISDLVPGTQMIARFSRSDPALSQALNSRFTARGFESGGQAIVGGGGMVATGAPEPNAPQIAYLPPSTRLIIEQARTDRSQVWLQVRRENDDKQFFVPIPFAPSQKDVDIGSPLLELFPEPADGLNSALIKASEFSVSVRRLAEQGKSIKWVEVAIPKISDDEPDAINRRAAIDLQAANTVYVLRHRLDIGPRLIGIVEGYDPSMPGSEHPARVRVRLFGR
ncbi:MAG: caspase family protein [Rhodospirillales bacterium]